MSSRAPRNRTLTCTQDEIQRLSGKLANPTKLNNTPDTRDTVVCADINETARTLPNAFVDLLILDPPYNLSKNYNGVVFKQKDKNAYQDWLDDIIGNIFHTLKDTASVYICSDWRTSIMLPDILEKYFYIRNRITWEREKGRGSKRNWKNNTEDIWFCTVSENYYFNVDSVKLKKRVIAPYRVNGQPKDWDESDSGNYRLTHPSNIWTDVTIPFWSMPENTDHPTQKPEKLLAKMILGSSKKGDMVFDPFLGSGTTAVVAKKLNRKYMGVEINREYCCWALKRLERADTDPSIQGYDGDVFYERNTLQAQKQSKRNHGRQGGLI